MSVITWFLYYKHSVNAKLNCSKELVFCVQLDTQMFIQ
jgi:hypothetical protein